MVGIKDIARQAGVSVSTVSYALNGSPKVIDETRDRILAIAKDLHYTPNLAGRTLKKQKTGIIGVYVHNFGGDFYSHMIDGIANTLQAHHYEMIVGSGGARSQGFIPQKLVDGAIILDVNFPTETIKEYADAGCRLVVLDRIINYNNVRCVLLDNVDGAKKAIDALSKTDIEHYILVTGPTNSYDSEMRMKAAISQVESLTGHSVLVVLSDFTIEGGRNAAVEIKKLGLHHIGIFALNDELAVGLYRGFSEYNLTIGDDIKIIGFDNDELGSYLHPNLTTVDYSKHLWGEKAAIMILKMISGKLPDNLTIKTKVIHRASLGEEMNK